MPILTLDKETVDPFKVGDSVRVEGKLWHIVAIDRDKNQMNLQQDKRNRKQRRATYAANRKSK